jgi:hypothetical protein
MSEKLKNKALYYFNKSFIEHAVEIIKFELKVNGIDSGFIINQIPGDIDSQTSGIDITVVTEQTEKKIHDIVHKYPWKLINSSGYFCVVNEDGKHSEEFKKFVESVVIPGFPAHFSGKEMPEDKVKGSDKKEVPDVMRVRSNIGLLIPSQVSLVGKIKRMGNDFHAFLSNAPLSIPGEYSREIEIAQKKIEEAVMWAVKGVTK